MFEGYLPQILAGAWLTMQLAFFSLLLGLVFGLIGAAGQFSRYRIIRRITILFITSICGMPELLVLFIIYFGGTALVTYLAGHYVDVSSFVSGVLGLALIFGAYASQVFRSAFLAVPFGQSEAAHALGLSRWQIFKNIQLPQAWRHALPGLGNLWLVLLKDTALVSLIGLADLMNKTQVAISTTQKPFLFYFTAALIYLVLTSFSQICMKKLNMGANRHLA
ncbi:MAG: artQ [Gammaproteobacteria bacterium]|jgi:His/Glu/Gln/Arg/opine family amino acid ABC transporter permease subunit|nr:artQ [Gammaproteobacteria bacterium]